MSADSPPPSFRLRPGYAVIPQADGVQLRAGDEDIHRLQGDDVSLLARLLNALITRQTRDSLVAQFGAEHEAFVAAVIEELDAQHCLQRDSEPELDLQDRFLRQVSAGNPQARLLPPDATVQIVGRGGVNDVLAEVLSQQRIATERSEIITAGSSSPVVCAIEEPNLARMLDVNAAAIAARRPCLFVDLSHGRHATIGPFYIPAECACYRCYRVRRRQNTASLAEFDAADARMLETQQPLPAFGVLPSFQSWIAGIAAAELLAFFTRHRPLRTLNHATVIALEEFTQTIEPVWRVPWCTACGRKPDGDRA